MNSKMDYAKAMVTGGAGFIGSHLVEKLIQRGIHVTVLDDLSVGSPDNIPPDAYLIRGDVCYPQTVKQALEGVEAIFHLAAHVTIRDSFNAFVEDVRTNVMGTVNLLKCAEGSRVKKFIFASSMAVYGNADYLPIDENHAIEPVSPYGISKAASEIYVRRFCEYAGVQPIILRYFNTYGIRQTLSPYVGVINIFIQKLLEEKNICIFGTGNQIRDFISVDDVANATVLASDYDGPEHVFNIGSGSGRSINSIATILQKAMHTHVKRVHLPFQPGEPSDSVANIELARRELGFEPACQLEDKLDEIIRWNASIKAPQIKNPGSENQKI